MKTESAEMQNLRMQRAEVAGWTTWDRDNTLAAIDEAIAVQLQIEAEDAADALVEADVR